MGSQACSVDLDPDITLMYVPGKPVPRNNLHVVLSSKFNRKPLPEHLQDDIEGVWQTKLKENPKLWNGSKFRLDNVTEKNESTTFHLGITSYKDFIGTNWSPNAKLLQKLGLKHHGNQQSLMSDALGVGSIVHTADNKAVLIKRSTNCGEAVGLWDIPGGHPEPKSIIGKIPAEEIKIQELSEEAVVNEIFDSTLHEIVDEINVPLETLSDPVLIGIARNTTSSGRPSSEYYVRCSLTSSQICQLYSKGSQAEAEESVAMKMLPVADVLTLQTSCPELWKDTAPSAKGCFTLFRLMVEKGQLTIH